MAEPEEYDLIALIRKRKKDANKTGERIQPPPGPATSDVSNHEAVVSNHEAVVSNGGPALNREFRNAVRPPPFTPTPRTQEDHPKTWETPPGTGDSVFYNGERYWVTNAPKDWTHTSFIQVADKHVRPGQPIPKDTTITSVHADKLRPAPVRGVAFESQPTERKLVIEQMKKEKGITDIGDEVGEMLRGKTLDQIYTTAAAYLHEHEFVLMKKYGHLNHGQQRMTLGNRMRAAWKKRNK